MGRIAVVLLAVAGIACSDDGQTSPDGGIEGGRPEVQATKTLMISVRGCDPTGSVGACAADAGAAQCCTGRPPLTLSFAPVGTPELTRFQWTFGDGTAVSNERAPSHTYPLPGTYNVTLIGGANELGSLTAPRLTVVVEPLAAGSSCDVDVQCGGELTCLCAPGRGCSTAFKHGICSAACDTTACDSGAVCAMAPAAAIGTTTSVPRCLASCQTSAGCAAGFVCQTFPAGPTDAPPPWTRGCLPLGAARDVGGSCRDARGVLVDGACATGMCADVGALGVCSAACDDSRPCPGGTSCAALSAGRQLCLLNCTVDANCAGDPFLACAAARPTDGTPTVCRPRSCANDTVCAPSGRCGPDGVCVAR